MGFSEKINILKTEITNKLKPLITDDCCLLELPYYTNIGDILIWQGTEDFLKSLNVYCKYKASSVTFNRNKIASDIIILLQGGGNFGDLWDGSQPFRCKIIKEYPDNPIIILPQTVFYSNRECLISDAELFNKHKNITICAREKESYKILTKYFTNNTILLVPDMAFCISSNKLKKYKNKQINKTLFLKRNDRELNNSINYADYIESKSMRIADWPSMEKRMISKFFLWRCLRLSHRLPVPFSKITDIYASYFFKSAMIKTGVKFITKYEKIYTTRLHAAILCCLLEKPFTFFDNSYGKNGSFFETWLSDLDDVEFH
jgi:pyruvyl transferase EpsO